MSDLLKIKVTREDVNSNDYTLTLIVPPEVDQDFTTSVVLTHPYTKIERVLPVSFVYNQSKDKQSRKPSQQTAKHNEPDYEDMPKQRKSDSKGSGNGGFGSYLAMFLVLVLSGLFIAKQLFGVNLTVSSTLLFLILYRALLVGREEVIKMRELHDQVEFDHHLLVGKKTVVSESPRDNKPTKCKEIRINHPSTGSKTRLQMVRASLLVKVA